MSLLPSRSDAVAEADAEAEPQVVGVDSERADELLAVLGSETARRLLAELHAEPASPAALADRADTSLQNVQYHLGRLEDSAAVEVVDTAYSEKGREMAVYAPTDSPLVIVAGDDETETGLRAALARLLGAIGVLGLASAVVQQVFGDGLGVETLGGTTGDGGVGGGGAGGGAVSVSEDRRVDTGATVLEGEQVAQDDGGIGSGGGGADTAVGGGLDGAAATEADAAADAATAVDENASLAGGDVVVEDAANASASVSTPATTPAEAAETVERTEVARSTPAAADGATGAADGATELTAATPRTATRTAQAATDAVVAADSGGFPPGLLFFAGGLAVLLTVAAVAYVRQ